MTANDSDISDSQAPPLADDLSQTFKIWQTLRLSSFQIGSAMGDILLAGVWNRIMISDFGLPAWPVGLLIALKNFMAPISLWIGHRSDTTPFFGRYRTSYIWLGRAMMIISFPLLGLATVQMEADSGAFLPWLLATLSLLLYGLGTLCSGSPFLALVRDSAPPEKQGIAIGLVETVLIALFPVVAIGFSRMLETYEQAAFWRLLIFVTVVGGFFWFFAVVGVEKRDRRQAAAAELSQVDFRAIFAEILADRRTRLFFVFLFVATFAAWMQDNILEPFGAEVFDMTVEETTRLTSYWGTATIVVLLASFVIWRRRYPEQQSGVTRVGLNIMGAGMAFLVASALAGQEGVFFLGLVIFGAGFGLYTFGGLSLMAVMSPDPHSGAYLGLWTVAILVSKGLGTFMGGVLRDIFLALDLSAGLTYGIAFSFSAVGLVAAAWLLRSIDIIAFAQDTGRDETVPLPATSMDF